LRGACRAPELPPPHPPVLPQPNKEVSIIDCGELPTETDVTTLKVRLCV
jgi:hypothetical protein